jgi:hypothetical protein
MGMLRVSLTLRTEVEVFTHRALVPGPYDGLHSTAIASYSFVQFSFLRHLDKTFRHSQSGQSGLDFLPDQLSDALELGVSGNVDDSLSGAKAAGFTLLGLPVTVALVADQVPVFGNGVGNSQPR